MRKQQRDAAHQPQHHAGCPANEWQPCDNMPHLDGLVVHVDSLSFVLRQRRPTSLRITAFIAALLVATAVPVLGQSSRVSGRVLDQTGSVLPGVTIDLVVQGTELTATTDNEGRYQF